MIIAMCGPSGIGKGFIKDRLLHIYPFITELKWYTTRKLRPNEFNGNRIHISEHDFNQLVTKNRLVLVQRLYGNNYGLKKKDMLPSRLIKLTELHPNSLEIALKINPEILTIGFVTSDLSLLHERLSTIRRTESTEEITKRIRSATAELQTIQQNKTLFTSVIEVTRTQETSVFNQVLAILTSHLTQQGEKQ